MPKMETANCTVKLGGDGGNTVPKYGVTVSEIVVLQKIHGNDAVVDIKPTGAVERSHRSERERLAYIYGSPQDDGSRQSKVVDLLFPGAAARLYETFAEAEIDEEFFATTGRVSSKAPQPAPAAAAPAEVSAPAAEPVEEDDGIGDMPPSTEPAETEADSLFQ